MRADLFEAYLGGLYLDKGLSVAFEVIIMTLQKVLLSTQQFVNKYVLKGEAKSVLEPTDNINDYCMCFEVNNSNNFMFNNLLIINQVPV